MENWPDLNETFNLDSINKIIVKLEANKKIVYTYGAWDLLHPGHIIFLERARSLGNFLVVGIVDDHAIKELKGVDRPLQCSNDRLFIVKNLRCVDAAIIQPEYDPTPIIENLKRVDVLTKGDDWEYIPGQEAIVRKGGQLIKLSYTEKFSTSSLVSKMTGAKVEKRKEY